MDVFVYKDYYFEYDVFYIFSSDYHYHLLGINLTKLYNNQKSYLISATDNVIDRKMIDVDDKDILFDENISKYIKTLFYKYDEILERAKIYNKEKEYKEILDIIKEKYGTLDERND